MNAASGTLSPAAVVNAMTVDVEDYFQVSAFESHVDKAHWHTMPCRVEANTRKILELFHAYQVRGTFFTLGWVAKRSLKDEKEPTEPPALVKPKKTEGDAAEVKAVDFTRKTGS